MLPDADSVILTNIDPELWELMKTDIYQMFYVDISLIGFLVVGSIAAFATFWALRGN